MPSYLFTTSAFYWPSLEERLEIKSWIKNKYNFKNCFGIIHGTQLRPDIHGRVYYTRKGQYALYALLIVDDNKCICHATEGWPGSIHDNRV
jgi:hypothetical protein